MPSKNIAEQFAQNNVLGRRDFIKLVSLLGTAAGMTAFLEACQVAETSVEPLPSPTKQPGNQTTPAPETDLPLSTPQIQGELQTPVLPTAEPSAQSAPSIARIALVKTDDREDGVLRAIDLLASNPISDRNVFLKPNFNSADPNPGSTHPLTLRALVKKLQAMGASRITVADRSGMGDTSQVFQDLGILELAQELGFESLILDQLAAEDWMKFEFPGSHWKQGFWLPKACLDGRRGCTNLLCENTPLRRSFHPFVEKFCWIGRQKDPG